MGTKTSRSTTLYIFHSLNTSCSDFVSSPQHICLAHIPWQLPSPSLLPPLLSSLSLKTIQNHLHYEIFLSPPVDTPLYYIILLLKLKKQCSQVILRVQHISNRLEVLAGRRQCLLTPFYSPCASSFHRVVFRMRSIWSQISLVSNLDQSQVPSPPS